MNKLFSFPIYIGTPERRVINNIHELVSLINKYNGIKPIYNCIYDIQQNLDKIFFDFDNRYAIRDVILLDDWCERLNLLRLILFSGMKGFHFYIFTKNYENIVLKKDVLYNTHTFIINEINKTLKPSQHKFEPDPLIIGNTSQSGRIPNTYHINGNAYCIPVLRDELEKGFDYIKGLSQKQRYDNFFNGKELFDISKFEKRSNRRRASENGEMPKFKYNINVQDSMLKHFPPCIQNWLLEPKLYCKNRTRYFFALFCKDIALPPETCKGIAKKYWNATKENGGSRTKYQEFIAEKQIDYAYRSNHCVPSCATLYDLQYCEGKCSQFKKNNFPIYID